MVTTATHTIELGMHARRFLSSQEALLCLVTSRMHHNSIVAAVVFLLLIIVHLIERNLQVCTKI